ncbi:uncharacterized protein LOC118425037 [Branchiostoma floridae]|uniref:Uncharacterized protein LOC118425037 n=1 Tax=Branchiostoma floridae TaxID=7739 RepID=A0A9J7LX09_BRAFL|nr:uncharacterized protein LOC118425037 [Branchiostoma floridae]
MAVKWVAKFCLVLVVVRLIVPCVEAGDWQHCQNVSPLRCSVGDSRNGGSKYRYDIAGYESRWNRDPNSYDSYQGPFKHNGMYPYPAFMSCYDCAGNGSVSGSSVTGEVQGVTLSPSQQDITVLVIADNNVGTMTKADATAISKMPRGRDCRLWLVNCNITTIEAGAFAKLPQVETLVIWRSNLQALRSGTFEGMKGLQKLLLLGNNITCLEAGAFDGLPLLRFLYLVDNQILTMAPGMLRGLQLDWLDVSANSIWYIAPGVLQGTQTVWRVDIAENRLQSVSVDMFPELANMRSLLLQYNEISWIADGSFHSNKRLDSLNLAGNRLTFLSGLWFKPTRTVNVALKGNAIAVAYLGREDLLLKVLLPDNPLRCTCANIGLYEHLWRRFTCGRGPHPRYAKMSLPTGCPAASLMEWPPVQVNVSSLPCPAPFVEFVNVEQNHESQEYEAVGNVYWEDLPQVSWAFANGSEYSMNITYNTNTTTHASLAIGNLTVRVGTYIRADGWVKCREEWNPSENQGSRKQEKCSNYMGKSSFTLWLSTASSFSFWNLSCSAISEVGSYTAYFDGREGMHFSQPFTTPQLLTQPTNHTRPATADTQPLSTPLSYIVLLPGNHNQKYVSESTWLIVFASLAAVLMILTRVAWEYTTGVKWAAGLENNSAAEQALAPREGVARLPSGPSAIVPYAVVYDNAGANSGDPDDQIAPYAITYDVEDDEITPYAEGHFRDHDSLCESDASDSSEAVPYGVSKLCDKYVSGDRTETRDSTPGTYRSDNVASGGPVSKMYGKDEPKETILDDPVSVRVLTDQGSPSPLPNSDRSEATCSTASSLPEAAADGAHAATPKETETPGSEESVMDDSGSEQGGSGVNGEEGKKSVSDETASMAE